MSEQREQAEPMADVVAYSVGLCFASVCTALSAAETTAYMHEHHPTGISSQWDISDEPFRTGEPNPCPCEDDKSRKHYLFVC